MSTQYRLSPAWAHGKCQKSEETAPISSWPCCAFVSLLFYLPRAALNAIADDAAAPRIGDLSYKPGASVNDATISCLGSTILPAFSRADQANRLFVDHVSLAAGIHLAQTYGGMRPVARPPRGGLARQERRAKEVLSANLDGDVPLKQVARECRLPVSHFSRAFRRTMGVAPHHWLLTRRIAACRSRMWRWPAASPIKAT